MAETKLWALPLILLAILILGLKALATGPSSVRLEECPKKIDLIADACDQIADLETKQKHDRMETFLKLRTQWISDKELSLTIEDKCFLIKMDHNRQQFLGEAEQHTLQRIPDKEIVFYRNGAVIDPSTKGQRFLGQINDGNNHLEFDILNQPLIKMGFMGAECIGTRLTGKISNGSVNSVASITLATTGYPNHDTENLLKRILAKLSVSPDGRYLICPGIINGRLQGFLHNFSQGDRFSQNHILENGSYLDFAIDPKWKKMAFLKKNGQNRFRMEVHDFRLAL